MNAKARRASLGDGLGMDGPAVAVKDQIGDGQFAQGAGQKCRPVLSWRGEGQIAGFAPEKLIAAIEADAVDIGRGKAKVLAQLAKERAMRALKEKETALHTLYSVLPVVRSGPGLFFAGSRHYVTEDWRPAQGGALASTLVGG